MKTTYHRLPVEALAGLLVFCMLAPLVAPAKGMPMSNSQELKVNRFVERITTARQKGDAVALQALVKEIQAEWPEEKDPGYFRVLIELCGALTSTRPVDAPRIDLVRKLVVTALDTAGDKPVDAEVKLLLVISADPDYVSGVIRGEKWQTERSVRVRRWLAAWRHLQEEKAKWANKVGGVVQINVLPPRETRLPGGVAPSAIKDPVLRKQYEEAIARNSERADVNRKKRDLADLETRFTNATKRYLISAYSSPPFNTEELEKSLEDSTIDKEIRVAIVTEVKKRTAAWTEREAKMPSGPPKVVTKAIEPPVVIPEKSQASHLWRNILIGIAAFLALSAGLLFLMWRRARLSSLP